MTTIGCTIPDVSGQIDGYEMTEQEVIQRIREAVKRAGSLRAFAKPHGLTASYIHDVLHKRRAVSERIAAIVGVERIVTVEYRFREIDTVTDAGKGVQTGSDGADVAHQDDE